MAGLEQGVSQSGSNIWRVVGWGAAVALLLLPFAAMQFTPEVNWTALDFVVFGVMLGAVGGLIELGSRLSRNAYYRAGFVVAVLAGFGLVWVNLAVGLLGDENNQANLLFAGVVAIAIGGSIIARGGAGGMKRAMLVTAAAQATACLVGLASGAASPGRGGQYEVMLGIIMFSGLWLISAALFKRAARA